MPCVQEMENDMKRFKIDISNMEDMQILGIIDDWWCYQKVWAL